MSDEKAGGQAKPQNWRRGNALDGRAARWVTKDIVYRQTCANDGRDNRARGRMFPSPATTMVGTNIATTNSGAKISPSVAGQAFVSNARCSR